MRMYRSRLGWLRQIFGGTRVEEPPTPGEAGQSTAQPPKLYGLCPAVGLNDNLPDGEWPADPDQVPGWIVMRENRRFDLGIAALPYRTRREFERSCALCLAALEAPMSAPNLIAPQMPPAEAAKAFLSWLRNRGHTGEHTDAELRDLYTDYCTAVGVTPSPEPTLRKYLAQLGGVAKVMKEAGKVGNHRKRGTVWVIKPSLAKVIEDRRLAA